MPNEFVPVRDFAIQKVLEDLQNNAVQLAIGCPTHLARFIVWVSKRIREGDNLTTLKEAKDFLRQSRGAGVDCPCCDQYVKLYKRPLTSEMANVLCELVILYNERRDWIPVKDLSTRGGDYAKLLWWELIEFEKPKHGSARASGGMKPTVLGLKFALRRAKVPAYVLLYNNRMLGYDGDQIDIDQVPNFSYSEIRARVEGAEHLL